jgi:hypothetical protein
VVELPPSYAGVGASRASGRIDAHGLRPGQIDHQAAIAHGIARDVVPAAADCHEEIVRAGEVNASHHVGRTGAASDQCWSPIDHAIPDLAGRIVIVVHSPQ